MSKNIIPYLKARGFVDSLTSEELERACEKSINVYVGFDPTADSLHLGNLIGIMALAHFQRFGHTPVIILGGTTGRIGDPSGKSVERPLLDKFTIGNNIQCIRKHFERVLDFSGRLPIPLMLNNDEWFENFNVIDFLRDVGKHFRINTMLTKDTVRTRLESEEGMSYTEFSYQLIQAYDFFYLHSHHQVLLQMGGSDQWGNITAGVELNRKLTGTQVFGLTWPLLVRSDGKKFGKSEQGAIWLAGDKCPPYQLYQYLFGIPDADVIHMLKMLTFVELGEIAEMEGQMKASGYVANTLQRRLAEEVTRLLHGEEGLHKAKKVTEGAGPGKEAVLDGEVLQAIAADMPNYKLPFNKIVGTSYIELAVTTGFFSSKGEGSRLIANGGAYLNNKKLLDSHYVISTDDLIDGKFLLFGAGKKKKMLVQIL